MGKHNLEGKGCREDLKLHMIACISFFKQNQHEIEVSALFLKMPTYPWKWQTLWYLLPHITSFQYCVGCSVHWRLFSTSGDNISTVGDSFSTVGGG